MNCKSWENTKRRWHRRMKMRLMSAVNFPVNSHVWLWFSRLVAHFPRKALFMIFFINSKILISPPPPAHNKTWKYHYEFFVEKREREKKLYLHKHFCDIFFSLLCQREEEREAEAERRFLRSRFCLQRKHAKTFHPPTSSPPSSLKREELKISLSPCAST